MITVGVTGGIGSGKSIACKVFAQFKVPIYNADEQAKLLMNLATVKNKITQNFGSDIYSINGEINKNLLASIIFNNTDALNKINAIVHPEVKKDFKKWIKKQKYPYVILESAILLESGFLKEVDRIITVYAPKNLRISRVETRSKWSKSEIISRMQNQLDDKIKIKQSNWVVYNNEKKLMLPQIVKIHKHLIDKLINEKIITNKSIFV